MHRLLILVSALALAGPLTGIPTSADAQVLAGRRDSAPTLDAHEQRRLNRAQDDSMELMDRISELEMAAEAAGGLTQQQQAQLEAEKRKLQNAERTIERLEARRARRAD